MNPLGRLRDEAISRRLLPDRAVLLLLGAGKLLLIPFDPTAILVVAIEEVNLRAAPYRFPGAGAYS